MVEALDVKDSLMKEVGHVVGSQGEPSYLTVLEIEVDWQEFHKKTHKADGECGAWERE